MKKDINNLIQFGTNCQSIFGGVMNFFSNLGKKSQNSQVRNELSINDFENIEVYQLSGISPESKLLEGAREGLFDWVEELIAQGVIIDYADEEGNTALIEAVKSGHYEIVELLLDNNANIHARTIGGSTALTFARENDYIRIQKLLLTKLGRAENFGHQALVQPFV